MTIDLKHTARAHAGKIKTVQPGSAAHKLGVRPGDELLEVNGHPVEDVIDVQYYSADEALTLLIRRGDEEILLSGRRQYRQELGLGFEHPTFDIDIRRCNNLCEFCFVLQMAPKMRRTLYIKDDDYRYSFLFGHFVTLTNLSPHDWERVKEQHLSPLYVSVHATDLAVRRECLRNATAPDILGQIRELAPLNFTIHTQLVITPGLNDGPILEQSIRDLAALWPTVRSVSIVPVGLTRHHKYGKRTVTRAEAEAVLDACDRWQTELRARFGVGFAYPTDEWYLITGRPLPHLDQYDGLALHENGLGMVRSFLDEWAAVRHAELPTLQPRAHAATLVTATLFAPTLAQAAAEMTADTGLAIDVIPVTNTRLGPGITVAGLLMAEDVIEQLTAPGVTLGDVVVLPRIMFDHPDGISLDDQSPKAIAKALNRPVALADQMGDVVDILQGRGALVFEPDDALIRPIMRDGGWAVEKYL
jgi:putative radical SAM enzyme (TIGR03279 family)